MSKRIVLRGHHTVEGKVFAINVDSYPYEWRVPMVDNGVRQRHISQSFRSVEFSDIDREPESFVHVVQFLATNVFERDGARVYRFDPHDDRCW